MVKQALDSSVTAVPLEGKAILFGLQETQVAPTLRDWPGAGVQQNQWNSAVIRRADRFQSIPDQRSTAIHDYKPYKSSVIQFTTHWPQLWCTFHILISKQIFRQRSPGAGV